MIKIEDIVGKSYFDVLKSEIPNITDEFADYILWEKTCYPIGSTQQIIDDLNKFIEEWQSKDKRNSQSTEK